uniref:COMM domain-containing protein n=1 Tax=Globisporangium ultimum (strain ATCC 200006 / CBS 805.95 / DAOM BR144) TaxID=431595 RepID=K3X595_GLOUD
MEFATATQEWADLLRSAAHAAFANAHFDTIMKLAIALCCAAEKDLDDAIDADTLQAQCKTKEEEQVLLSFAFTIKRLLTVIIRDRMDFLVLETHQGQDESSASQKDSLAQQQALQQKIPSDFQLPFLQALRDNWSALETAAGANKFSLPRVNEMQWHVEGSIVVMRIQTRDGSTRTMRAPIRQFHQLRYSTAKVLQEMNQVEAHPIMRLTNADQKATALATSTP